MSLAITPQELKERMDLFPPAQNSTLSDSDWVLLDVRNPEEFALCQLPGALLIPLNELFSDYPFQLQRSGKENLLKFKDKTVAVYCHHGMRSLQACHFLRAQGFQHVFNLTGGIDLYSAKVDESIPRY